MSRPSAKLKPTFTRLAAQLPILVFILALLFTWVTAYFYAGNILDSDASSELVLANLLAKENALLSQHWIYANELRVIQTNLIYAPLMKLFASWHTVRFVGILMLQSLLLLSYFYLGKQLKWGRAAKYYSAAMLVMPFSIQYGRIVLYHTYYLPFVAIGFLLVGMLVAVQNRSALQAAGAHTRLRIAVLLAVGLLAGLNGVRQLMITMVPMLAAAVLVAWAQENAQPGNADTPFAKRLGTVALTLGVCATGAMGYLINRNLLGQAYTFRHYDTLATSTPNAARLADMFFACCGQFGYQTGRALLSVPGMLAVGGLAVVAYLTFTGIRQLTGKALAATAPANAFVGALFPFAVATMLAVFLFFGDVAVYPLYLIPVTVWAIPFLGCRIQAAKGQRASIQTLLLGGVCALVLANGIYSNVCFIHPADQQATYDGLSWQEVDTVPKLQGAVGFLTANGYQVGYASFWNANVVTELTNGAIPMIGIRLDEQNPSLAYDRWLTDTRNQDAAYVAQKRVFLLLRTAEVDLYLQTPLADYGNLVYSDDTFAVYDFDDSTQPYDALLES